MLKTDGMKRVFLSYLWNMPPEKLAEYSKGFAVSVMPAIYPEGLAALERHRQAGHLTVLTSASPEFYVSEIGKLLGFDLVLGTVIEMGPFFPDLENHRGLAKSNRLHELLPASYFSGDRLKNSHGYTDSTADLPLLALCEKATLVNPKPPLLAIGKRSGWEVIRPARPWKSKANYALRALNLLLGIGKDPGGLGS
jgi:phosphoserine phosphatase